MPNPTEQKVISAARECFFQHGYRASNMTMISEYAGLSRATVHKYARNKDDAFRKVCLDYQEQAEKACEPILEKDLECWVAIELIIGVWLKPTFDEVGNTRIINDLKYHVNQIAQDVFNQARNALKDMLAAQIEKGLSQNTLSLSKLNLSSHELASLMLASIDGLRGHYEKNELSQASQNTLSIFKLACSIKD